MYIKVCNIDSFAVYAKDLEPHMKMIGFWKSEIVKVIVLVAEYDAVDKQKCFESFGSSDFQYYPVESLSVDSDQDEEYEYDLATKDLVW